MQKSSAASGSPRFGRGARGSWRAVQGGGGQGAAGAGGWEKPPEAAGHDLAGAGPPARRGSSLPSRSNQMLIIQFHWGKSLQGRYVGRISLCPQIGGLTQYVLFSPFA